MKIRYYVSTNKVGSRCEDTLDIDKEEWEDMDEKEKDELIHDIIMQNIVDWGYDEEGEEE